MRVAPEPDREVIASRGDDRRDRRRGRAGPPAVRPAGRRRRPSARSSALDREPVPAGDRPIDLLVDDVKARVDGAMTVIHLASAFGPAVDDDPEIMAAADVEMARRVLDAAAAAGTAHVVVLSSATVYGAWPNNPVPLTEEAPLRPDPGLAFAVQKAEIERLTSEWRDQHPGTTVTVLRPATPVADGQPGWLARALRAAGEVRSPDDDPPVQFLHLDDLVAAIDLAARERLDGVYNVAPDGWLTADRVPRAGGRHRQACGCPAGWSTGSPTCGGGCASAPRRRPGCSPTPAGAWVVANDRLQGGRLGAHRRQRRGLRGGRARRARSPRSARAAARSSRSAPPASLAAGVAVGAVALVRRARRRR